MNILVHVISLKFLFHEASLMTANGVETLLPLLLKAAPEADALLAVAEGNFSFGIRYQVLGVHCNHVIILALPQPRELSAKISAARFLL